MNAEIRDTIMFTVSEGGRSVVRDQKLTTGEKQILLAMAEGGHVMDIFFAYMAETYPLHPAAPTWRSRSGTHNGVRVSAMLHNIPADPRFANEIEERFVRTYGGEVAASVTLPVMVLVIRLSGEDFLSFRRWDVFAGFAREPLKIKGGGTA